MAYDATRLSTDPIQQVRFLLGGKRADDLVADEEIEYTLSDESNKYFAAATIAESLASQYANEVSKTVGPLSYDLSAAQDHWQGLADRLRARGGRKVGAGPILVGQTYSERELSRSDTDRVRASFRKGMHDDYENPGNGNSDNYGLRTGQY